jgi:hypothetical protein
MKAEWEALERKIAGDVAPAAPAEGEVDAEAPVAAEVAAA